MLRISIAVLLVLGVLVFAGWATDSITPDGERTIYTVACEGGSWRLTECSGKLVPSKRYRFRALKAHNEVLFWTPGDGQPSGKYSACTISGGRDWQCPPNADATRTITHQMVRGLPVPDPRVHPLAFHQIEKWRWGLLKMGVSVGNSAMN